MFCYPSENFVGRDNELRMNYVDCRVDCMFVTLLSQHFTEMPERLWVLVDEHKLHIEENSFRAILINFERRFFDCFEHAQRRTENEFVRPFELISAPAAESVYQRYSDALASACIEQPLLEVADQIVNKYLVLRQAMRFELGWAVAPIVVTFCQGELFRESDELNDNSRELIPVLAGQNSSCLAFSDRRD